MTDDFTGGNSAYVNAWAPVVAGRIFTIQGAMHYVLEVDRATGSCRVSRRSHGHTEVIFLPLEVVVSLLARQPRE